MSSFPDSKQSCLTGLFKNIRHCSVHLCAWLASVQSTYLIPALATHIPRQPDLREFLLVSWPSWVSFSPSTNPCLMSLVYTNSFLTTLNSRSAIADEFELKATAQRSTAKSIKFRIMTTQESIRDEERGEREACDVSFSNTNEPAKIRRGSLLTKGRNDSNDDFVP